jgi:hypothetical protein
MKQFCLGLVWACFAFVVWQGATPDYGYLGRALVVLAACVMCAVGFLMGALTTRRGR